MLGKGLAPPSVVHQMTCVQLLLQWPENCVQHSLPPMKLHAAYNARRLIALDNCPGVRLIDIGEVVRRIIGKAVLGVISQDIQAVTGTVQLCTGQIAGIESATSEGMLLIDAKNAFNSLNRHAALRNISLTCPTLATIAINTYREDIQLFIEGETALLGAYSCVVVKMQLVNLVFLQ